MMYVLLVTALVVCVFFVALTLFLLQSRAAKKRSSAQFGSGTENNPVIPQGSVRRTPQMNESRTSEDLNYLNSFDNRANRTARNNSFEKSASGPLPAYKPPSSGSLSTYEKSASGPVSNQSRSRRNSESLAPLPSAAGKQTGSLGELIRGYEQGMRTGFDDNLGAILFVTTNVVMTTPQEVTIAFQVCTRQIQGVLRPRGLEQAALLTDIAGLVIGRDATASWGQALKTCLDQICIKVDQDTYLVAHFNSKASRPGREELQEKIRRIQFMTSASINSFQSNIFDTREEAVAFLKRMREFYRV